MRFLVIISLLCALFLVFTTIDGREDPRDPGEYWGEKAIEGLVHLKLNDEGRSFVSTMENDPTVVKSNAKNFEPRPNPFWQYTLENDPTAVKDFNSRPNPFWQYGKSLLTIENDPTAIKSDAKGFDLRPNPFWQYGKGIPAIEADPTSIKSDGKGFDLRPSPFWQYGNGIPKIENYPTTIKENGLSA